MSVLAIKGHSTRGEEVIEILGMLGGSNAFNHDCDNSRAIYYIDEIYKNYVICAVNKRKSVNYAIFTLEEFLEKFPYKVGDRVRVPEYESEVRISKMYWDGNEVQYEVVTDEVEWYSAKELNEFNEPNKEKTINIRLFDKKETAEKIKIDIPKGYEFVEVANQQIVFEKICCQYPKTYEECSLINGCDNRISLKIIGEFTKLINARNAYWKIAGEQMGLGKPWKPDFKDDSDKYFICYVKDEVWKSNIRDCNRLLVFPTAEMRDAFYEHFKDLIEQCKELL